MRFEIGSLVRSKYTGTIIRVSGPGLAAQDFSGRVEIGDYNYRVGTFSNQWNAEAFEPLTTVESEPCFVGDGEEI